MRYCCKFFACLQNLLRDGVPWRVYQTWQASAHDHCDCHKPRVPQVVVKCVSTNINVALRNSLQCIGAVLGEQLYKTSAHA